MLLVLYPILSVYFIEVCGINLSIPDILLLILFPFLLFKFAFQRFVLLDKLSTMFLGYVFLHFLLIANSSEVLVETAHFFLVLLVIAFFCPNFFDKELGVKLLILVSLISSIYLIIQFLMLQTAGIYLPGQIPIFNTSMSQNGRIRPFSFFSEPAAFGTYNNIGLATILYSDNLSGKKKKIYLIIISLSLFLVTSTTALGLMVAVWLIWLKDNRGKIAKRIAFFLIVFVPIVVLIDLQYGILGKIIEHSFLGLLKGQYAGGLLGRIGGLRAAFLYNQGTSIMQKIFGSGMINLNRVAGGHYLPTVGRLNVYYGISGYIVVSFYFIEQFLHCQKYSRCLLMLSMVSMFFSETVFGIMLLWYMPYVMGWKDKDTIAISLNKQKNMKDIIITK